MQVFYSFVLILALSLICAAQKMSDRDLEGLKGKVQIVEEWSEDFEPGRTRDPKAAPQIVRDTSYDESGNKTKSTFHPLGSRKLYFIVDEERVSRSEHFEVPGVSVLRAATPGSRDERYEAKYEYDFDKNGKIIEIRGYMSNGVLDVRQRFSYDNSGRLMSETSYAGDKLHYKETFNYDPEGTLIASKYVGYDGYGTKSSSQSEQYTHYKYDKAGNWIERRVTRLDLDDKKAKSFIQIEHRKITYF